ncbi:MBL fold metallo-hydrolase [Methylobacterium durans]|uniref:MBL fold metallo-hydrolase n=1 Tax=Methylobacterium durans TaxID=2202825 RepID=A0A2U8WEB8_9HYPH|nr:MBL fold metallo-hydrolase [Methylobacterium durans]AWN43656.1 MBL fold metallo-hydrolase [Methylobacterium durans]
MAVFVDPASPGRASAQRLSRARITCDDPARRDILCGGGAAALSLLLAGLLGDAPPALAEAVTGPVPELDAVAVRIVTDSYQFAVAPGRKLDGLAVEHFGWGIGPDHPPGPTPVSEFGLSMHVTSRRGEESRQTLVDFGFTPEALVNNLRLLGVRPSEIDALVLSHGHYDHFGGLAGFLGQNRGQLKPGLPFHVGGEDCFCAREWTAPPAKGDFGVIDRQALKAANLAVTATERPALVAGHGFTSGQIDQRSFETLLSPSAMKLGLTHGSGCDPAGLAGGGPGPIPDQFRHEIATAYNLKGQGLIILTSCSHRGVVNAIRQAQAVSGVQRVHAVIGGFHLAPYQPDYVRQTLAALKEIGPNFVVPLHCTGEAFYEIAKAEMPTKLVRAYTGTRLVFNGSAT